jgi:hypothetical protein
MLAFSQRTPPGMTLEEAKLAEMAECDPIVKFLSAGDFYYHARRAQPDAVPPVVARRQRQRRGAV